MSHFIEGPADGFMNDDGSYGPQERGGATNQYGEVTAGATLEEILRADVRQAIRERDAALAQLAERDAGLVEVTQERDRLYRQTEAWRDGWFDLQAQIEAMRGVVEAARAIPECVRMNYAIHEDHSCVAAVNGALAALDLISPHHAVDAHTEGTGSFVITPEAQQVAADAIRSGRIPGRLPSEPPQPSVGAAPPSESSGASGE